MTAPLFRFTKPPKEEKNHVNILLLGETGVGKSTFINAFSNYLQFESMDEAQNSSQLLCLITAKFSVVDDDYKESTVVFQPHNADKNEDTKLGNSSTQTAKSYVFHLREKSIRLIDTPGIGDARGVEKDLENVENILDYIGQYSHLHAICILLKPNVTVIQAYFKYCIIELLTRLHKSASRNIIFVFTNTRGSDYKALETWTNLRSIMMEIAKKNKCYIPMKYDGSKESNVFCFDNEGFKYIVAQRQGVRFGNADVMRKSWDMSKTASWRLINYILGEGETAGLVPHQVQNSVSINECRRLIIELSKPLADISELIQDNITALERHQALILKENISIKELKAALYIPSVDIRQMELSQPVTICTASKCSKIHTVLGIKKYHYDQRCHNPCYLSNVPKEIIGAAELLQCAAMGGTTTCKQCKCDFSTHMHIYYETETFDTTIEDTTIKSQIKSNEDTLAIQYELIKKLQATSEEYEKEHSMISKSMAKFAHFLKANSICPVNDAYREYLEYLIGRENVIGGNMDLVKRYRKMKQQHAEEIQILEKASANCTPDMQTVDPDDIMKTIQRLYTLPKTGSKIRQLHKHQGAAVTRENRNYCEYVHNKIVKTPMKKKPETILPTKQEQAEWVSQLLRAGKTEEAYQLLSLLKEGETAKNRSQEQPSTSGTVPKPANVNKQQTYQNQNKYTWRNPNYREPQMNMNQKQQQQPQQYGQNLRFTHPNQRFNAPHWNFQRPAFTPSNFNNQSFANPMPGPNQNYQHFPFQGYAAPYPVMNPQMMEYQQANMSHQNQQMKTQPGQPQFSINVNLATEAAKKSESENKLADKYAEPPPPYHAIPQKKMQQNYTKTKVTKAQKRAAQFKKQTIYKQAPLQVVENESDESSSSSCSSSSSATRKVDEDKIKMMEYINAQRKIVNAKLKEHEAQAKRMNSPPPPPAPTPTPQPAPRSQTNTNTEDAVEKMRKLMRDVFKKF